MFAPIFLLYFPSVLLYLVAQSEWFRWLLRADEPHATQILVILGLLTTATAMNRASRKTLLLRRQSLVSVMQAGCKPSQLPLDPRSDVGRRMSCLQYQSQSSSCHLYMKARLRDLGPAPMGLPTLQAPQESATPRPHPQLMMAPGLRTRFAALTRHKILRTFTAREASLTTKHLTEYFLYLDTQQTGFLMSLVVP